MGLCACMYLGVGGRKGKERENLYCKVQGSISDGTADRSILTLHLHLWPQASTEKVFNSIWVGISLMYLPFIEFHILYLEANTNMYRFHYVHFQHCCYTAPKLLNATTFFLKCNCFYSETILIVITIYYVWIICTAIVHFTPIN